MPRTKTTTPQATTKPPADKKRERTRKSKDEPKQSKEEEVSDTNFKETPSNTKKSRRSVTRETVLERLDNIIQTLEDQITSIRGESTDGTKRTKCAPGVRYLRGLVKEVKATRNDAARVMKQRQKPKRASNNSSGFMKPVKISSEMARFTGWKPENLASRVEVTKYICDYIKENDLQNPKDRRQILPDDRLKKLLKYNEEKDGKPLTYYFLQKKIQPHFTSSATPAVKPTA